MTIRVVVVDDHAVVRSGLRRVLEAEDDIEVVAEAGDTRGAVFEARAHEPDVVLMEVVMPRASGIEAISTMLREAPDVRILILSMQDDPRYVHEAFSAGASGYVLNKFADGEIVDAVREVANGDRYIHPAVGARLFAAEAEEQTRAEQDPLSDREREVLRLLARGHTNQEIAKMLYLSVRTIETHRAHIMQKLRLKTRAELVSYAIDQGLLQETGYGSASGLRFQLGEEQAMSRAVVVLPLREGTREQASKLLRGGPPFDPAESGLEQHHVFLTEREAVFVFEAEARDAIERLIGEDRFWSAASAWTDLVGGPPRLAEDAYSWVRPQVSDDVSFEPTPGPGDSDGGDLF